MWIDVASDKHYLNAIEVKKSALNPRKPLVGGRDTTSALGSSGSSIGPSSLVPTGIHQLLLSNLTTAYRPRNKPWDQNGGLFTFTSKFAFDGGIYMKVIVFLDFVVDSQYTSLRVNLLSKPLL